MQPSPQADMIGIPVYVEPRPDGIILDFLFGNGLAFRHFHRREDLLWFLLLIDAEDTKAKEALNVARANERERQGEES
jgi:hypothetical protein